MHQKLSYLQQRQQKTDILCLFHKYLSKLLTKIFWIWLYSVILF